MDNIKKEDIKLLIFKDENNKVQEKYVLLLSESPTGIYVKVIDSEKNIPVGKGFFLPWHSVNKIKDVA